MNPLIRLFEDSPKGTKKAEKGKSMLVT